MVNMAIRTGFRTAMRWVIWPVIVVGGLNIENRATKAGYGEISLQEILGRLQMSELYQDLTSDTALHILLFVAGGSVFAWVSYWLEYLEKNNERWALSNLSLECETMTKTLEGAPVFSLMMKGALGRLNTKLVRFGFDPVPTDYDRKDKERNERTARYLRAIAPAMRRDLNFAKKLGLAALNLNQEIALSRRPQTGIGAETQP